MMMGVLKNIGKGFLAIVILSALISSCSSDDKKVDKDSGNKQSVTTAKEQSKPKVSQVTYTQYSVATLMQDLDKNALKAAKKYKGQSVELTGRLHVIDSEGRYISIVPTNNDFAIIGVTCSIRNNKQKDIVADMNVGDIIVVKGKIDDVGEVMGYSLDIDEIRKR